MTIIMNELVLEVSTEMEVNEDLCQVRILVSYKYMVKQNLFGRFDPINNHINLWKGEITTRGAFGIDLSAPWPQSLKLQPNDFFFLCTKELMIILCPFRSLPDEGREKIMAIFEQKRSPENQALMELLREEKRVYRLCLKLM
jgi:hypothetical protein